MPKLTTILNSIGKTINLAKPNSYYIPRKPPLNTLIFEKLPECGPKVSCGVKSPPNVKPVRVCTREALQAFYCPPPCDCKVKVPPLTFAQKLGYLMKQLLKGGVVGALVYYTYKEGLWSDPFRSSCFLGKFVEFCPEEDDLDVVLNEFMDVSTFELTEAEPCFPFIPRTEVILYKMGHMWNTFIIKLFWTILDGPMWLLNYISNFFKSRSKGARKKYPCQEVRLGDTEACREQEKLKTK